VKTGYWFISRFPLIIPRGFYKGWGQPKKYFFAFTQPSALQGGITIKQNKKPLKQNL
jgi:hypothetical protein